MSIFNELLPKLNEIPNAYIKNFNDDLKVIFECFDKFEEEYQNGRGRAREKGQKEKPPLTTLQSINEDDDDSTKTPETAVQTRRSSKSSNKDSSASSDTQDSNSEKKRVSNKRTKNEVDGIISPEQDKRQKRNASVKAQNIITQQVNVNLTQKLRREDSSEKQRSRRRKDDDKENRPVPVLQIKLEKISLPPEPMDTESLPLDIDPKKEPVEDEIAMPPPVAPVPKPRKLVAKEKSEDSEEESSGRRRTTRTKKQTDSMAPPPAPAGEVRRSTRTNSRTKPVETEEPVPTEPRPKRTRAKKKASEIVEADKDTTQILQTNETASPAEKPRPKRTRRAQKVAEKLESQKSEETTPEPIISPKEETTQADVPQSPILQKEIKAKTKETKSKIPITGKKDLINEEITKQDVKNMDIVDEGIKSIALDETRVLENHKLDATVTLDQTIVLPNGVYNHAPVTPKNIHPINETFNRETIVLEKEQNKPMDATIVLYKDQKPANLSEDDSLLTDDNSDVRENTPAKQLPPPTQPTSAVKEKVQQFEELASRVTRTKTRAMAKKEEQVENQTPPDKISKPVLSAETLTKMNNLIFNGKASQISSSASKLRANIPPHKSLVSTSSSKLSAVHKAKEAAEESLKREKEDARKKKEAMLEAKREQQKRKREEKMAAAAAAREAAEKERRAAIELAARERMEKQAHADQGRAHRIKEAERKKIELARKVAETEERRRAEEQARQQRLADEQRRADAARRKQLEEAEATKKEAALITKEIEKKRREYEEKQKKGKAHTPLKMPGTPGPSSVEPVYMADGFQYLNSDEEQDMVERPVPVWSTSKARKQQLLIQTQISQSHVDKLFSVRVHTPDLRDIFPNIERTRLKRTSSAVWRTPQRLSLVQE